MINYFAQQKSVLVQGFLVVDGQALKPSNTRFIQYKAILGLEDYWHQSEYRIE